MLQIGRQVSCCLLSLALIHDAKALVVPYSNGHGCPNDAATVPLSTSTFQHLHLHSYQYRRRDPRVVGVQLEATTDDPDQTTITDGKEEEVQVSTRAINASLANNTTNVTKPMQNSTARPSLPIKGVSRIGDLVFLETRAKTPLEGFLETLIPPVVPLLAFFNYDSVADAFRWTVTQLSRNSWLNDGSRDPTTISALNSIVVPTSAILYATLTATTINAMRQRQQSIRESINKEASELRILRGLLKYFPEERQDRCRFLLIQYISRVIEECQPKINLNELESRGLVSEINDFIVEVNALVVTNTQRRESRAVASQGESPMSDILIFQVYDSAMRLESCRNDRLSAMQNTFPILHYIVLFSLAFSITVGFLIETNKTKVDSDFFQLRVIWTMMVASFSALGVVSYDLNSPFGGNYSVQRATDQLYAIRFSLRRDYVEKERQLENLF